MDAFPPAGWVTNHEAARRLGVSLNTLTCNAWKWRRTLQATARCVNAPGGGRCNLYRIDTLQHILDERDAARRVVIPDGFVDMDGAAAFFGLARDGWKNWVSQGKVRFGQSFVSSKRTTIRIYAIADLQRLRAELFSEDKLHKTSDNRWHVPADFVRRDEAWEKFGVQKVTWERWEREGVITCGTREGCGPKLYKVEDIERMLDEYGKWCPPYPDPERPGVVRVPLSGRGIKRREALIDADALPLIEGGSCSWSKSTLGDWAFVSFNRPGRPSVPLRRVILGASETNDNVRHANSDPLDCRRDNLVVRTVRERARNARKPRTHNGQPCTSRFKGVYWEAWTSKWRAHIKAEGRDIRLGRFHDELAAAEAYDEAARELFGEHARLNFPEGIDAFLEREAQQCDDMQSRAAA